MKQPTQALLDKWERKLRSEGMPDEFPATRRQALSGVHDGTSDGEGLSSSSTFLHWTAVAHAANALPRNWKGRAFMISYAESGYLQATCTKFAISLRQGRNILARFAQRKAQNDTAD